MENKIKKKQSPLRTELKTSQKRTTMDSFKSKNDLNKRIIHIYVKLIFFNHDADKSYFIIIDRAFPFFKISFLKSIFWVLFNQHLSIF